MGLFDSDKETYVSTSVSRVLPDELVPDSTKVGLLKGILKGGDITAYALEELVGSVGMRSERMYAYAAKSYSYGLPSGEVYSATQGTPEVEAVIEALEGSPIVLKYCRYGPPNKIHVGWMKLISDHGYDPLTNKLGVLSTQKGKDVYLQSMQVVYPSAAFVEELPVAFEVWGNSPNAGYTPERAAQSIPLAGAVLPKVAIKSNSATEIHLKVIATWEVRSGSGDLYGVVYPTETFTIAWEGFDAEADYFHACYEVAGQLKYWIYEVGSGTYPTLDALYDAPPDEAGTYFPNLYFRYNYQSMLEKQGTEEYATSEKLAQYLGIDYAMLIEAVHENPDIADIYQAMMIYAVPAGTQDPQELRYLFEYFNEQHTLQPPIDLPAGYPAPKTTAQKVVTVTANKDIPTQNQTIVIQDKRKYRMTLSNGGIFKRLVPGSIGAKGTYAGGLRTHEERRTYYSVDAGMEQVAIDTYTIHYYQHQISDSTYEEIEIYALTMTYRVDGRHVTAAKSKQKTLLIPLDHSITRNYTLAERERLYSRAMHFVFNTRVEVTLEWYEQEWFSDILMFVAVVLIVVTYGQSMYAYAAAVAAGTVSLTALLIGVLIDYILVYALAALAFKYFVKAIGAENAFIVAVVTAVAAVYFQYSPTSVAGAPWASRLLSLSTNLASAVAEAVQESFIDLAEDYSEFSQYVKEQLKLLEDAQDLLKPTSLLSPIVIFGETPEDFYNRTVHSSNIGTVGISAISNYVDAALTLPSINETLGENKYGLA